MTEQDRKAQAFTWMNGWACGAGYGPIPPELEADKHFMGGFAKGRQARAIASDSAQRRYGVTFQTIRLASPEG